MQERNAKGVDSDTKDGHLVIAIQDEATRGNPQSGPGGRGWRDDGAAFTHQADHVGAVFDPRQIIMVTAFAINSHAGAADGDQTNRSHAAGGPVGLGIQEEVAYSLRAGRTQSACHAAAVRRLTPTECERLMGLPDGYTLVPYRGKPAADGPRYKALGNSIAINCLRWIGERIALVRTSASEAAA